MKQNKITYCKYCGGELDENKKCKNCGKQYLNIKLKSLFTYFLIISVLFLIYKDYSLQKERDHYKEYYYFSNIDYEEMSEQNEELAKELDYYKRENEALFNVLDDMEIAFAIDGTKYYHKGTCEKIQNNAVKDIQYNTINNFLLKGYKPCPDCYKK